MKVDTNTYVKEYYEGLKSSYPLFIRYLDYINTVAGYVMNIDADLANNYKVYKYETFKTELDRYATITLVCEILESISKEYKDLFLEELRNNNIKFSKTWWTITSVRKKNNRVRIYVKENNDISDVIKIVHEMLHLIHLKNMDCDISAEEFYFYSEMYAVTGDFYSIFYLLENNIMKDDVLSYLKNLFLAMIENSDTTISNGTYLYVYDRDGKLDNESLLEYVKAKNFPKVYEDLEEILKDIKKFNYHEAGTYIFSLPISLMLAKKMITDDKYKDIFQEELDNVKDRKSENIINRFGLWNIFIDDKLLFDIMTYFYNMIESLFKKESIDYQKKIGELW